MVLLMVGKYLNLPNFVCCSFWLGIKPYRKIAERYDRTAQRTLIKTGLRTGTEAGTTGTV